MKPEKVGNFIMTFQRKAERLDWRKVASLDIDKVIQEPNWEELKELFNQITFCHPESEFNQEKTDPGFIKVFRISQILMEYLVSNQEANTGRAEELQSRCQELEAATKTYLEQIENLKLNLTAAKKELKKRKEMLAATQSEVLLGEDKDEFDQCPYCSKKFLTGTYLFAHMQRRHQGLPIHSAFPISSHSFPAVGFPIQQTLPMAFPNTETGTGVKSVAITAATQTEIRADAAINQDEKSQSKEPPAKDENINDSIGEPLDKNILTSTAHKIDLHIVSELVEKYLEQKSIARQNQHYDEILSTIRAVSENRDKDFLERRASISIEKNSSGDSSKKNSFRAANPITTVSIEEAERNVSKMREELHIQCQALKGQVRESGIEELKERFLDEMQKMQELILSNSPRISKEVVEAEHDHLTNAKIDEQSILERSMDERFQKQEEQLEEIKLSLQNEMQTELGILELKLETQEEYWKSQLMSVEENYQLQLTQLREELQQAYYKKSELQGQIRAGSEHEKILETNKEEKKSEIKLDNVVLSGEEDKELEINQIHEDVVAEESPTAPVAKPRKTIPVQTSTSVTVMKVSEVSRTNKSMTDNSKPQRRLAPQPPVSMAPKEQALVHEYEEPKTFHKDEVSDYSYSVTVSESSESETQVETDEELVQEKVGKLPKQTAAKYVFDAKKKKLVPIPMGSKSKEQLDKMEQLRQQAVAEISDQMQRFGINPDEDGTLLTKEELRKNLGKLKSSRSAITDDVDFDARRNTLKKEVDLAVKKLAFEEKIEQARLSMDITPLPELKPPSQGPLTKIIKAVKNSNKWRQPNKVVTPTRKSPKKKHSLKTFFSKVNWGKKGKNANEPIKVSRDEETSEAESSVDIDMPPYMNRSKPVANPNERKKVSLSARSSGKRRSNRKSDQSGDTDKIEQVLKKRELTTHTGASNAKTDTVDKQSVPMKQWHTLTNNSSGRYVTVPGGGGKGKQGRPTEVTNNDHIREQSPMNGDLIKKIPAVFNGTKKRDLLQEFQNAKEVKQPMTVTNNMYSPIKKVQGDRNFYDTDDGSGDSHPNYSQQELSEYSEEDEQENDKKNGKPVTNSQKGQYVTLRHSSEVLQNLESGDNPANDTKDMETSTPIKDKPMDKPHPSTSGVQTKPHSTLFSSASAWDSDSATEEKVSFRNPISTKQNNKENPKMIIPSVAPKAISRASPSPFKIIKRPIPATANETKTQKPKSLMDNSWDNDSDY